MSVTDNLLFHINVRCHFRWMESMYPNSTEVQAV